MRHSLDVFNRARADYAAGELTVDAICRKYDMSPGTLMYWVDGGPMSGSCT